MGEYICGHVKQLWETGDHSDVAVLVEGRQYALHKIILAQSEFFAKHLASSEEGKSNSLFVDINCDEREGEGNAALLGPAIGSLYSVLPRLTQENVLDFVQISKRFDLRGLYDSCCTFVRDELRVDFDNVVFCCAEVMNVNEDDENWASYLKSKIKAFVLRHSSALLYDLPWTIVESAVLSDSLYIKSEFARYELVKRIQSSRRDHHDFEPIFAQLALVTMDDKQFLDVCCENCVVHEILLSVLLFRYYVRSRLVPSPKRWKMPDAIELPANKRARFKTHFADISSWSPGKRGVSSKYSFFGSFWTLHVSHDVNGHLYCLLARIMKKNRQNNSPSELADTRKAVDVTATFTLLGRNEMVVKGLKKKFVGETRWGVQMLPFSTVTEWDEELKQFPFHPRVGERLDSSKLLFVVSFEVCT